MERKLVPFLLAYGGYVLTLHLVVGPWRSWSRGEALDNWTLTHVAWGAIAKRMGLSARELLVLSLLNEGVEWWLRRNRPDLLWGEPETLLNVALDLGATGVGWAVI